jgi:ribosomal protein S18 acetylase RimI-like enzyme
VSTISLGGHHLVRVGEDDEHRIRSLQALLDADPATWAALEGAPPRPDEARHMLGDLPPGVAPDRKYVWISTLASRAATSDAANAATSDAAHTSTPFVPDAVIDIVDGYPDPTTWYLGLIFIAPRARNAGLGAALLRALAEHVRANGGTAMRLAVVADNLAARRLYDRLGFVFVVRRSRPLWTGGSHECDVLELRL